MFQMKVMKDGAIATLWPLQNAFERFNSYTKIIWNRNQIETIIKIDEK